MKIPFVKRTFKNSYYGKMLFLYSGIFLLSSVVMTSILFYNQQKNQLEVQEKNSQNILTQFQIYTDHYILDQVYGVINQRMYNNSLNDDNLLFNSNSYRHDFNNFDAILDVQKFFTNIVQNSNVIQSIYVYHKKNDTFVSTQSGCYYFITDRRFDYQKLIPYQLLDYASKQSVSQFWIPPAVTSSFYSNTNMASLVLSLPVFTDPARAELLLMINLDMEAIFRDFLSDIDPSSMELVVLNEQQEILYSTVPERLKLNALPEELMEALSVQPSGSFSGSFGGNDYRANWMRSTSQSWKYVFLGDRPNLVLSVFTSAGGIFLFSLIVSLLCLLGIYLISNWLYRPIERLVSYSRSANPEENGSGKHTDELSTLDAAFRNMSSHIDRLKQVVDQNNSLLVSNTVKELINGNIHSMEELNGQLSLTGEAFSYPCFLMVCTRIDETVYADLDYQKRSFLQISVIDYFNRYFRQNEETDWKALSVFHHSGDFTTVINIRPEGGYLTDLLPELLKDLSREYGEVFNMAVGPVITDFAEFQPCRSTLLGYFKYYYLYGNHNVFTPERIAGYENDAQVRAQAPLTLLSAQLRRQNTEAAKQEVSALFQQSLHGKNSLLYTYNLSLQLINLICGECENLGIQSETLSHPYLVHTFSNIRSLEGTVTWFHQIIDEFTSLRESRNTALDASVIPNILKYMEQHVDGQLSLNSVADHFGISTGHLSRMFKEKQGVNFSDYLIRLKLETAARMLVDNKSLKVTDITSALGYSNISYFNKMFKEYFGMTPVQYRKQSLTP